MHDQELLQAKNGQLRVRIILAQQTYFSDEAGSVFCQIEKVDKFAIRIVTLPPEQEITLTIWLMKQAILSTQVVA